MTENQDVCVWVVPLDAGDSPPVIVAGDLQPNVRSPRVYAGTLDDFTTAWAWDLACLDQAPVIQAQADGLDPATEGYLNDHLRPMTPSWGWPTRRTLRYERDDGLKVLLWDGIEQCDWWISAPNSQTGCVNSGWHHADGWSWPRPEVVSGGGPRVTASRS